MDRQIRVIVAGEVALHREDLAGALRHHSDISVTSTVNISDLAGARTELFPPNVIVLSLMNTALNTVNINDMVARVRARYPEAHVLVVSAPNQDELVVEALRAGAHAAWRRDNALRDLASMVRDVERGDTQLQPGIATRLMRIWRTRNDAKADASEKNPFSTLTARELEVLKLISTGMTNAEISESLHLAEGTVKNYVTRIMTKVDVKDRTKLAVLALRTGLVKL
jgi:DNA-binding NarL/FixJ family response regulator